MADQYRLSFKMGDTIAPGNDLKVNLGADVDAKAAVNSVRLLKNGELVASGAPVDGEAGNVKISTDDLTRGNYQLHITTTGEDGKEVHDLVPVRLDALAGKVPPELRIEHTSRVSVGEFRAEALNSSNSADASFVDFVKAVNRESGEFVELAFDQAGKPVDGKKLLADAELRRYEKFGTLHESLFNRIASLGDSDTIEVAVLPKSTVDITAYEKPNQGEIKEPVPEAVKLLQAFDDAKSKLLSSLTSSGLVAKESGGKDSQSTNGPGVLARVTREQAQKLSKHQDVAAVYHYDRTGVPDLAKSLELARAGIPHSQGHTGQGVRVAVFEEGPSDLTNLSFEGRFNATPPASSHARMTSGIIKNTEPNKPHGFAPDCLLYSANSWDNDALDWAVGTIGCTVVNQSFHRDAEQTDSTLSFDDIHKDWLALKWPFPTIVHASGNGAATEYVNHKGFNTLTVGNNDDTRLAMSPSSVFRNPASAHGDRELPEIAANGTDVTLLGLTDSGTSFSSPAVAGTAALVQGIDATLKSWPEGTRAILLASTMLNVTGGTWGADRKSGIDAADGTGAVDARFAVEVAGQRSARNNAAARSGWDVGSITDADVGADGYVTFQYAALGAAGGVGPPLNRVKVALAWDSAADNVTSSLTRDFDLFVEDTTTNTVMDSSATWDNSYEIVQFLGSWGRTYRIRIRRFSGTGVAWYGIAWRSETV